MKRCASLSVVSILAGAVVWAQAPAPVIAIKAARLFDGRSNTLIADATVLVQGTRITAAGARLTAPAGAQVIDLGDATIITRGRAPRRARST